MRMAEYEQAADAYVASRHAFPGDLVEQARLIQKEAIAPLRLGRYAQTLDRLDQAIRSLEDVDGVAAAAQRARLFGWYASVLHRQRPATPSSSGVSARSRRLRARAPRTPWPRHSSYSISGTWRLAGKTTQSTRHARRRSTSGSEISIVSRLFSTHWAFAPTSTVAGTKRSSFSSGLDRFRQDRRRYECDGRRAEHRRRELRPGEDGGGRCPVPQGPRGETASRKSARDRRGGQLPRPPRGANGQLDEARALLEEARSLYAAENDEVEVLMTDSRLVECLVLAGAGEAALALADETLRRAEGCRTSRSS